MPTRGELLGSAGALVVPSTGQALPWHASNATPHGALDTPCSACPAGGPLSGKYLALRLAFQLPTSCYATMLIRELTKMPTHTAFHKAASAAGAAASAAAAAAAASPDAAEGVAAAAAGAEPDAGAD